MSPAVSGRGGVNNSLGFELSEAQLPHCGTKTLRERQKRGSNDLGTWFGMELHQLTQQNDLEHVEVIWLGGRDSNPDTVVQRAVNGFRSVPVHSVLFKYSALPFQYVALRSALFTHKMSHCVSGSDKPRWPARAI